eukprot:c27852_g1_i2 orf=410-2113(-)
MASHRSPSDITFGFSLRAIRLAGSLGLRLIPSQEDIENLQSRLREGITGTRGRVDSGRSARRNSQHPQHLHSESNSDAGDESREEEDSEEEPDVHMEAEYRDRKAKSEKARSLKQETVAQLEHVIGHMTKLRVTPSEGFAKFAGISQGTIPTVAMLSGREFNVSGNGKWSQSECCHVAARFLPVNGPTVVAQMESRAYVGQFSADGSLFVAGFQDRRIQIYNVDRGWTVQKDILARNLRWTVTDTALSHDQRFLIYATITPVVHLVNVGQDSGGVESLANITDIHEGLDFSMEGSGEYSFGLYSVQFSHDGREIVAGSSDKSIYVYDLEENKPVLRLEAHKDDVNAVTFADETCHLIYSGSDDHNCKVWDRRCLASKSRPAGFLVGHLEGITFIDSRGDGRYFISNGKDQSIKLWDIRMMTSTIPQSRSKGVKIPAFSWDYRWMEYPGAGKNVRHPYDQSLMTYKGHAVLRTLVRCHFSPAFSTGQKYIYTGSHDGCVYIYDLVTGRQTAVLNNYHRLTVRDCSWHPVDPVLVSSSWDGIIAKWEYRPGFYCPAPQPPDMDEFFDSD